MQAAFGPLVDPSPCAGAAPAELGRGARQIGRSRPEASLILLDETLRWLHAIPVQQAAFMNRSHEPAREDNMRQNFETQARWSSIVAVAGVMGALGALYLPLI
jgi:hypothetical protein